MPPPLSGTQAHGKLADTSDSEQQPGVPPVDDIQRIARLRRKAERVVEHLATEHDRFRKSQQKQITVNRLLTAAVIALGVGTVFQYIFLGELRRDANAVQKGVDSANASLNRIIGIIEHNEQGSQQRESQLARAIADVRASILLREVDAYLNRLEQTGDQQFGDAEEKADLSRKLKPGIRRAIVSEIETSPDVSDMQVRTRIRQLVDADLGRAAKK